MKLRNAKFNSKIFADLPKAERDNLVSIAHFQNELRFSLLGVAWTKVINSESDVIQKGQISYNLFFLKMLAGKLYEGWKMLSKHHFSNKELSMHFRNNCCSESRDLLMELKGYFSKANAISKIRNDFSFHYSPEELGDRSLKINEDLDIYISAENDANSLYYFAEAAANWSMIGIFNNPDDANPLEVITNEIIGIAKKFNRFNTLYIMYLINKQDINVWDGLTEELEIENLPLFNKVRIPFFTDTGYARKWCMSEMEMR